MEIYDTVYGSGISVQEKCEYFHHRRPGRKESSGHQPDPGESGGGTDLDIGLRALMRQDPDIIMVGETRDGETASTSVRAAITGHVVLSTLHTNDAVSSIVRLEDMGVETYLVANSVVGLVAQRLLRKVCPDCAKEVETLSGSVS